MVHNLQCNHPLLTEFVIYNPWIDFHSYLRIRSSMVIHMGRDIQSNIQYSTDNDQGTENCLTSVLVYKNLISHLRILSVTICDTVPIVTTATGQAGILLKKAVIFACNSRLLILTFWINWSCCCTNRWFAQSLCQKAIYKKTKNYHCLATKFWKSKNLVRNGQTVDRWSTLNKNECTYPT